MFYTHEETQLTLAGLTIAPAQVCGKVRLVPLLAESPFTDLRIGRRDIHAFAQVQLKGKPENPKRAYYSYFPHGLVVEEGNTSHRTNQAHRQQPGTSCTELASLTLHRMVKREGNQRFRMLPLHLAFEGFMAHYFNGPDIAWPEYTKQVLHQGLSPRIEQTLPGHAMPTLEEALRVFEIHEGQVGVLLFVGGSFTSAFVAPNPMDYRLLHHTLLRDFYGNTLLYHGLWAPNEQAQKVSLDGSKVIDLASLGQELARASKAWGAFDQNLLSGLLARPLRAQKIRDLKRYRLIRFSTGFHPEAENHLGEAILHQDGRIAYLKTYRMDRAQARRVWLLEQLAEVDWHPETAAARLGTNPAGLRQQLKSVGLGMILRPKEERGFSTLPRDR